MSPIFLYEEALMSNAASGSEKYIITGDYDAYLFCFLYFFLKCLLRKIRFWSG